MFSPLRILYQFTKSLVKTFFDVISTFSDSYPCLFSSNICFVLFGVMFLSLSSKSVFSIKSLKSALVAKHSCLNHVNLAVQFHASNTLNS